jgi:hypothetical protein
VASRSISALVQSHQQLPQCDPPPLLDRLNRRIQQPLSTVRIPLYPEEVIGVQHASLSAVASQFTGRRGVRRDNCANENVAVTGVIVAGCGGSAGHSDAR